MKASKFSDAQKAVILKQSMEGIPVADILAHFAEYKINTLQDLDKVKAQVSELMAELRVRQSTLTAPIDGIVQQLAVHTIGGVVTTAESLLSVVPDQPHLIVETMAKNEDVGFVHAGQTARVKINTFNFTRYGLIDGTVLDVTRDASGRTTVRRRRISGTRQAPRRAWAMSKPMPQSMPRISRSMLTQLSRNLARRNLAPACRFLCRFRREATRD